MAMAGMGWSSLPVEILTIALTVVASATAGMVLYRVVEGGITARSSAAIR